MGNGVKGFPKVQVDNIHSLSLILLVCHLVREGHQVIQAGPAFHKTAGGVTATLRLYLNLTGIHLGHFFLVGCLDSDSILSTLGVVLSVEYPS